MALVARDLWVAPSGAPDPVVRGVSLSADRGEWLALSGPNGGGKSTLALALGALLPLSRGTLEWEGEPLSPARRVRAEHPIAVILQDPSSQLLAPTVREEIGLTARNLGRPQEQTNADLERLAERLGLAATLGRDARSLSAGQQQSVLLAAALCARPALLVADEATAHLDERARTEAMDLIAERVTQGMTAIWVSQREEEICRSHRRVTLDREAGLRPWSPSMESAFDPTLAPEAPETADACRILLELEIAPGASAEGPHIEVAEARRVTIPESGIVRVCGPNGCGKTVLLQALAGLVRLDSTRLVRGNWPLRPMFVGEYPEREIFEELVRDEVLFAATRRGETRKRALDGAVHLLDRLGLSGALMIERRTWRLSGGERRLVQLVSTLNAPADLLLLDEPTAGLDPGRRRALGEVLIERARQTPVVVATQQPRWPPGISFRHAVLLGVSGNRQNLAK